MSVTAEQPRLPAVTSHTTSAARVLRRCAEQSRGTQDALARGANSGTWGGSAVQHVGSAATSSRGTLEPSLSPSGGCTASAHVHIPLPRGCHINIAKRFLLLTKTSRRRVSSSGSSVKTHYWPLLGTRCWTSAKLHSFPYYECQYRFKLPFGLCFY